MFGYHLQVIGRLRDGVSLEQAQAQMDRITAVLAAETPRWFEGRVARVVPLRDAQRRFTMLLMGLFGVLAIVIAGVGIYGVMAYLVAERTREIGVRLAVGASPAAVRRMVLTRAFRYVAVGLLIGLPS